MHGTIGKRHSLNNQGHIPVPRGEKWERCPYLSKGNVGSCRLKGDGRMFTGMAGRFVLAVVVLMFGSLSSNSFAAEEAKSLALSKALVKVKLFAGLTDAEREALKTAAMLRRGKAGERIIEQGKTMDRMFIIVDGQAEVWANKKHIVTLSGQPLVGEIEFLDTLPGSADVLLSNATDLIELNYAALTRLMEKQPRLGYILMREIARIEARRLRDTNTRKQ